MQRDIWEAKGLPLINSDRTDLRSGKENSTLMMHCAAPAGALLFSKFTQRYGFTRCARSPNAGLDSFAPARRLGFRAWQMLLASGGDDERLFA